MADKSEEVEPLSQEEIEEIYNREWKKAGSFDQNNVRVEGKHVFAEIQFPGGGVYENGELINSAILRAGSGKTDMLLMNSDFEQAEALKRMITRSVEQVGEVTERGEVTRMVREELLLGDYNYLIFKVRQLSVGDKVVFNGECNRCNATHEYSIRVSDLEFEIPEGFDPADPQTRFRTFDFEFYGTKWQVNWHLATEGDIEYLKKMIDIAIERKKAKEAATGSGARGKGRTRRDAPEEQEEKTDLDYRYIVSGGESGIDFITSNLLCRIDSVVEPSDEGEKTVRLGRDPAHIGDTLSRDESVEYIRELPSPLRLKLWQEINAAEPEMDTEILYECLTCGKDNSQVLHPLSPNFFFPSEIQLD